jgi:hypothetical protein
MAPGSTPFWTLALSAIEELSGLGFRTQDNTSNSPQYPTSDLDINSNTRSLKSDLKRVHTFNLRVAFLFENFFYSVAIFFEQRTLIL